MLLFGPKEESSLQFYLVTVNSAMAALHHHFIAQNIEDTLFGAKNTGANNPNFSNNNDNNNITQRCRNSQECHYIIVGGSSGMGKAAALATVQRGGAVIVRAKEQLLEQVPESWIFTRACDVSDISAVQELAKGIADVDVFWNGLPVVVSAAGKAPHGSVVKLPTGWYGPLIIAQSIWVQNFSQMIIVLNLSRAL